MGPAPAESVAGGIPTPAGGFSSKQGPYPILGRPPDSGPDRVTTGNNLVLTNP